MTLISLIANDPSRFDSLSLDQLQATADYEGMVRVVGLPDLHAGNGIAVGAAFWSRTRIWPHLVGSDIGCGMALWETTSPLRKFRLGTVERKLQELDAPWPGDGEAALKEAPLWVPLAEATILLSSSGSRRWRTRRASRRLACDTTGSDGAWRLARPWAKRPANPSTAGNQPWNTREQPGGRGLPCRA